MLLLQALPSQKNTYWIWSSQVVCKQHWHPHLSSCHHTQCPMHHSGKLPNDPELLLNLLSAWYLHQCRGLWKQIMAPTSITISSQNSLSSLHTTFRQKWGGCICLNIQFISPPSVPCSLEDVQIRQSRRLPRLSERTEASLNVYYRKSVPFALILSQKVPKQLPLSVVMEDNSA